MPLDGIRLGHYQLVKQIGGGGMSEVYLAQDLNLLGRQVAIKFVRTAVAPYPASDAARDSGKLFQREARAIALLDRHLHILPLYDFGEEQVQGVTVTYLVMPYRPEGSLVTWLRQRSGSNTGILLSQEVEYIISQAADALQYAHNQHVIHRDVKPSNFLIQYLAEANLPYIQLADFGIAKINTDTSSMSQSVRGTTTYMPPEQWRGKPLPATDQYALAIMAYELLTGRPPFQGDVGRLMYFHSMEKPQPPSTFNPNLSPDIDTVILHALEKEPEQRFKSIAAFANAFQQAVRAGSVVPIPPPPPPRDETPYPVSQPSGAARSTVPVDGGSSRPGATYPMPFVAGQGSSISGAAYAGPSPYVQTPPGPLTPPPPSHKQPWYRSRVTLIASIGLVLLLVLSGVIYTVTATGKNPPPVDTTATARANNATATTHATATARINATAAARVNATSTAIVQATARVIAANPDPYPPNNGRITLLDPLVGSTSDANWNTKSGCFFVNRGYHASENQSNIFNSCFLERPTFSNFALQVDMTVIRGDCGGIVFRSNSVNGKEYFFRVCQDNQMYYLYNCPGFNVSCQTLISNTSSDINAGLNQMNRIAIVADGSGIDLYINNTRQDSITDTAYASGNIGLSASTLNNHTETVFQNLKVWVL